MDELEPVGYDGFGAPLYEHQLSPNSCLDDLAKRMEIPPGAELPEVYRRFPYPVPFDPISAFVPRPEDGWKDVGYLSEDSAPVIEWRDPTPLSLAAVEGLPSLSGHLEIEIAVRSTPRRDDYGRTYFWADEIDLHPFQREMIGEITAMHERNLALMFAIPIRQRPFCEHELPSVGQE